MTAAISLPVEYLRVYSPSAEVRGHGPAEVLQVGVRVAVKAIEPAGMYAISCLQRWARHGITVNTCTTSARSTN